MISKVNIKTSNFSSLGNHSKKESKIQTKESLKNSNDKHKIFEIITKASVHLGHQEKHPNMKSYIYGKRNNRQIFDLNLTFKQLYQAKTILDQINQENGTILFVCTRPVLSQLLKPIFPNRKNFIFINYKWVGGSLTNWDEIMNYTLNIKETNKIKTLKKSKIKRFQNLFNPFLNQINQNLDQGSSSGGETKFPSPALVVLFHGSDQIIPLKEARKTRTPVIAVVDSDCDPREVTQPIPGNDDNIRSLQLQARTLFHGL